METGRLEVLSSHFAIGWAVEPEAGRAFVQATCRGRTLGVAPVDIARPDLVKAQPSSRAFIVVFSEPVGLAELDHVEVNILGMSTPLKRVSNFRKDTRPFLQIFVLGSPRSGTSELAGTLATSLELPWLGEGHAAPLFAAAASALSGNTAAENLIPRVMANHKYQTVAFQAARSAYYWCHNSSSFLDKTPGVPMIRSAAFLTECFPEAKFIYIRRNGISNVLSRMVKFGGQFESHCRDWAAAMDEWMVHRQHLPHYIEVEQEQMLNDPSAVATRVTDYIERPEMTQAIADSLRVGSRQRTGAGLQKTSLSDTGWSAQQIEQFRRLCGPTMQRWGYPVE